MKRNEEERKALNVNLNKKQKKNISLAQKFSSLNLKAKYTIDNISKMMDTQSKSENRQIFTFLGDFDMNQSSSHRRFENIGRMIESARLQLPAINTKSIGLFEL